MVCMMLLGARARVAACVQMPLSRRLLSWLTSLLCLPLPLLTFITTMADAPAPQGEARRRRAERQEEARNVRQRMDEAEVRLDEVDSRLRGHETRLKCLEAPYRIVARGFDAVCAFLATLDAGDFKGARTAFIPSFIQELRDKTG